VAQSASSILSFNSPTSTSDAPPTLITATPPVSLPNLSYNFSLSYSEVVISIAEVIYAILSSISALSPDPPIIIVSSLDIIIFSAEPNTSNSASSRVKPTSSLINYAPVAIAISYIVFLLLSPNPGDFTAHTYRPPLNLFNTSVASASPSTSSATIKSYLLFWLAYSKNFRID
jgi:hypothetical protein